MPIDLPTLQRARSLDRDAVEEVVNESFPAIARIAYALTGRDDAGNDVIAHIVRRGLHSLPKWRDEGEPQRWFLHHTILACRRETRRPSGNDDLLLETASSRTTEYQAFIRALRSLPQQQVEAFVLHHGESFNLRYMAVAMDCSIKAAEQHLSAATATLRAVAGEGADALTQRLRAAYAALSPAGKVLVPRMKSIVRRHVWPRRLWRVLRTVVLVTFLAGVAWFCWRILPAIEY